MENCKKFRFKYINVRGLTWP